MAYIALQLKESHVIIDAGHKLQAKGETHCAAYCKDKGFFCNDWTMGTGQNVTCAQACMLRMGGKSKSQCMKTVAKYKITPSCFLNIPVDGKIQKATMCTYCRDRQTYPKGFFKKIAFYFDKQKPTIHAGEHGCYYGEPKDFDGGQDYDDVIYDKRDAHKVTKTKVRKFCSGQ